MDIEKENNRVVQSSPLPPLSFITGAISKTENSERNNLKTKCPPKVDTPHVTVRQNAVDLDWNYQVFNDNVTKDRSSVIIISDDDEEVNEENCLGNTKKALTPALKSPTLEPNRIVIISDDEEEVNEERSKHINYFTNHNEKNCLGNTKKALTPALKSPTLEPNRIIIISDDEEEVNEERSKHINYFTNHNEKNCLGNTKKALTPTLKSPSLEPNRIENIKKSLKRPHSRELQGISPKVQPDGRDERHKRRLEFIQFSQDGLHSPDYLDYMEDLFPYLLSIETKTAVPSISSEKRACIINWLIRVNGPNGNPAVIQTSQSYFDAVLAAGQVQLNPLQLVAAACYWIAQKNHTQEAFSARTLVEYSTESFTIKDLLSAEEAVVKILKFPSQPVIPQEYITYLSWYCDSDKSGEIEVAATVLCMAGLMVDKSLCNMYPSVIGAAAVKNAVLLLRGKEALVTLHMNSVYKSAESKVPNISLICSSQRKAIRCMSSLCLKDNALLKYYGNGSHLILQKIVKFANEFSDVE